MPCYDDGALRAYLDDALPAAEQAAAAAHVAGCAACQGRLEGQRALAAQVGALFAPVVAHDPHAALARFRTIADRQPAASAASDIQHPLQSYGRLGESPLSALRRTLMQTTAHFWSGPRRGLFAGLAAVVLVLGLLALPPVRAAAGQLLLVFRVQKVVFVPISPERIAQLQKLNFDPSTLFTGKPKITNQPAQPRVAATADAAASAVGFTAGRATVFPRPLASSQMLVHDRTTIEFQVDVESARQLLGLLGVDDVTLPDALGAKPIVANIPPHLETRYRGTSYSMTLYQGRSPTATLPDGVDLRQLGRAALRVLGMEPDQAEAMSRQIDWNSTLLFPFPKDIRDVRQVQIGDTPGLLVGEGRGGSRHWQLYWQRGDRFMMLEAQGNLADMDVIAAADSVR